MGGINHESKLISPDTRATRLLREAYRLWSKDPENPAVNFMAQTLQARALALLSVAKENPPTPPSQ